MAKLEVNFKAQGLDKVKTLIEVLNAHIDELPQDLVNQLNEIADCDVFEYDAEHFKEKGLFPVSVHADGYEVFHVVSINPILKRIKALNQKDVYFDFCNVICNGSSVLTIGAN